MRKSMERDFASADPDIIFERFKMNCPYVIPEIKDWWPIDKYVIIIELFDGSAYVYDYILDSFRYSSLGPDHLKRKRSTDEEEWRRRFARELYRNLLMTGMSQLDLSYETGVSSGAISNYINATRTPSAYHVIRFAKALGCDARDLIDF